MFDKTLILKCNINCYVKQGKKYLEKLNKAKIKLLLTISFSLNN